MPTSEKRSLHWKRTSKQSPFFLSKDSRVNNMVKAHCVCVGEQAKVNTIWVLAKPHSFSQQGTWPSTPLHHVRGAVKANKSCHGSYVRNPNLILQPHCARIRGRLAGGGLSNGHSSWFVRSPDGPLCTIGVDSILAMGLLDFWSWWQQVKKKTKNMPCALVQHLGHAKSHLPKGARNKRLTFWGHD